MLTEVGVIPPKVDLSATSGSQHSPSGASREQTQRRRPMSRSNDQRHGTSDSLRLEPTRFSPLPCVGTHHPQKTLSIYVRVARARPATGTDDFGQKRNRVDRDNEEDKGGLGMETIDKLNRQPEGAPPAAFESAESLPIWLDVPRA
jgi:hypothetical protein